MFSTQTEILAFSDEKERFILDEDTGELLEILSDFSATGKERPWREYKVANEYVEKCYKIISRSGGGYWLNKSLRLKECGCKLFFDEYLVDNDIKLKLKYANSCRVRMCPLCMWRRSLKIHAHVRKILNAVQSERQYRYILLTLTVPNVPASELSSKIDEMNTAFYRLARCKRFKNAVKGWYRGLEVTYNIKEDTYHPHFHCILCVSNSYFLTGNYMNHSEWLNLWRKAMKDNRITQVDVRTVKPKGNKGDDIVGAVCEVAKYTVKITDYVIPNDILTSCRVISVLDLALANRRLVAFGGIMKDWHKKLNLDDETDGDLVHVDADDELLTGEPVGEVCYFWHTGYKFYIKEN